eukprot:scaffold1277_cov253-Pinguiococcus_pyrenoidosus.AAC.58
MASYEVQAKLYLPKIILFVYTRYFGWTVGDLEASYSKSARGTGAKPSPKGNTKKRPKSEELGGPKQISVGLRTFRRTPLRLLLLAHHVPAERLFIELWDTMSNFKQTHPLVRRIDEANRIRQKYPDRVPVICERVSFARGSRPPFCVASRMYGFQCGSVGRNAR